MRESLDKLDAVLVGSQASGSILTAIFPELSDRILRLSPPLPKLPPRSSRPAGLPLKVGLLGNFTKAKGATTALAVFGATRGFEIEFHICGRVDDDMMRELRRQAFEHVTTHGVFEPGVIPESFRVCQVALILSPWPETYCISLSEAQSLGVVPIVTALGAQAERVVHGQNGFVVEPNDANAVVGILRQLAACPDRITTLAQALPSCPGKEGPTFAAELAGIYDRLLAQGSSFEPSSLTGTVTLRDLDVYVGQKRWLADDEPSVLIHSQQPPAIARSAWSKLARFAELKRNHRDKVAIIRALYWLNLWSIRRIERRL